GRTNTTLNIIGKTNANLFLVLAGNGYKSVKDDDVMNKLGYGYGIVGLSRDIVSGGWIVMLITMCLYIKTITSRQFKEGMLAHSAMLMILLFFLYTHLF